METNHYCKQRGESQDYVMNENHTTYSLTVIEVNATPNHISKERIESFILCIYNTIKTIQYYGITVYNNITRSDHCGLYLDIHIDAITNPQDTSTPSPFKRKINSKSPHDIRKYNKYFKKNLEQKKCE